MPGPAKGLEALLGEDAAGLSSTNIARLTAGWEKEYTDFRQRDLSEREYVYVWVDDVHFNIRLDDDRLCTLMIIGARPDGRRRSCSRSRMVIGRECRELEVGAAASSSGAEWSHRYLPWAMVCSASGPPRGRSGPRLASRIAPAASATRNIPSSEA